MRLEEFLGSEQGPSLSSDLARVIAALAQASCQISRIIGQGTLENELGRMEGELNTDGDVQKALDVLSNRVFVEALRDSPVAAVLSEEMDSVLALNEGAPYFVAIDPLDGSANIDIGLSIGTIACVRAVDGSDIAQGAPSAALFVIYGPQTMLVLSFGAGVDLFVLDRRTGHFTLARRSIKVPVAAREYAINTSNRRHWSPPVRRFVEDCEAGRLGPLAADHNMRWIASLVAEAFRVLVRGGVFLYPADARPGYERGRLRLAYEAHPIAFIMEQAGGGATDGDRRILDIGYRDPHERTPLVFGSAPMVELVRRYVTLQDGA